MPNLTVRVIFVEEYAAIDSLASDKLLIVNLQDFYNNDLDQTVAFSVFNL